MGMTAKEIEDQVKVALPDAQVVLEDMAGDNDHWKITVTSAQFQGRSRVDQHRMVMGALSGMGSKLHALAVTTKTP